MKKILITLLILILGALTVLPVFAAEPRDCDGNAILYCGAYSTKELYNKIYGERHLKEFFTTIGIHNSQYSQLKDGVVKKDGTVWVNGSRVASGVYSSGRHITKNSIKETRVSTVIYWRPPSDSFKSDSIPAYVYLNYDGSFGYAIIKSCGNPITNSSFKAVIKTRPVPPPAPKPKYDIVVNKFEDLNKDKRKNTNEKTLSKWKFTLKGNGLNLTGVTNNKGQIIFKDLPKGTYTLTETLSATWINTTNNNLRIVVSDKDVSIWFGNIKRLKNDPLTVPTNPDEPIIDAKPLPVLSTEEPLTAVKGASISINELPKAGAKENIALIVLTLGLSTFYYIKSKKNLKQVKLPQ